MNEYIDTDSAFASVKLRVVNERAELDEKIEKLSAFINTTIFERLGVFHRAMLRQQLELMKGYSEILTKRIEYWD